MRRIGRLLIVTISSVSMVTMVFNLRLSPDREASSGFSLPEGAQKKRETLVSRFCTPSGARLRYLQMRSRVLV